MANTHQPRPRSLENTLLDRRTAKQFREMFGATQSDIAEDARISQSKLSLYESGFVDLAEKYASWSKKKQIRARQSMRRQAKLTQIEVARELGITPKKLRHWEAGRLELSEAGTEKWQQVI